MKNPKLNELGAVGQIDTVLDNTVSGWLTSLDGDVYPILKMDNVWVQLEKWQIERPDVNDALGVTGNFGFRFNAGGLKRGSVLELYACSSAGVTLVSRRTLEIETPDKSIYQQLLRARAMAANPEAVAITCWEAGHNPIGRAMVLRDCIAPHRPVMLFAYLFPDFSGAIWPPISKTRFDRVLIPWGQRREYLAYLRFLGMEFSTVWMCKPRLPTFELAANVSGPQTRFLLDHDDNEDHFSRSQPNRAFGSYAMSSARHLASKVTSHTVASASLADTLPGSRIVRHARESVPDNSAPTTESAPPLIDRPGPIRIGFVGTVRRHKGLLEAARAIQILAWRTGLPLEFHVHGDFSPVTLRDELKELKVVTGGTVPSTKLNDLLASFDLILTGYTPDSEHAEITRYQISSKIGDGLAVHRPVLVPEGPSVADLADVPGIYLFGKGGFGKAVVAAAEARGPVSLPPEFTRDHTYASFGVAEQSATSIHSYLRPLIANTTPAPERTLVLLWKQDDAGLYGRRIDIVARDYKRSNPDHRVIVLEFMNSATLEGMGKTEQDFCSDSSLRLQSVKDKQRQAMQRENVEYHVVHCKSSAAYEGELFRYLAQNGMTPQNTRFLIFPIVPHMSNIIGILQYFDCVVDVVDNQLRWTRDSRVPEHIAGYLLACRLGKKIIFNSEENRAYFTSVAPWSAALCEHVEETLTVPNWYSPPDWTADYVPDRSAAPVKFIYSGNLNERIDWPLFIDVVRAFPDAEFHVVGGMRTPTTAFNALLEYPNLIYWGPLSEDPTLRLISECTAGLVIHTNNDISHYMNPLKVMMYQAMGLPVVATCVQGIAEGPGIDLCTSPEMFLRALARIAETKEVTRRPSQDLSESAKTYLQLLAAPLSPGLAPDCAAADGN